MARVSLIVPVGREGAPSPARLAPIRLALESSGHDVEILIAAEADVTPAADTWDPSWTWVAVRDKGRAAAAITGLARATGDWLIALDPERGYVANDVLRVVDALACGSGKLVIGSRNIHGNDCAPAARLGIWLGSLGRLASGTSDPFSGLVGLDRSLLDSSTAATFEAVGAHFSLELLAKLDATRADVAARPEPATRRERVGLDELRHFKRLADHRFGNFSRLIQFCVVGASGMVVDISLYAIFQWLFARTLLAHWVIPVVGSLDLAVSALLSVAIALCWNFSLNRRLTFSYARQGSIIRQFVTYAASNALAITLNLGLRLALPRQFAFFAAHKLAAAVVGVVLATGVSFSMSRWVVFRHRGEAAQKPAPAPLDASAV